jgi:hypothetical protein
VLQLYFVLIFVPEYLFLATKFNITPSFHTPGFQFTTPDIFYLFPFKMVWFIYSLTELAISNTNINIEEETGKLLTAFFLFSTNLHVLTNR